MKGTSKSIGLWMLNQVGNYPLIQRAKSQITKIGILSFGIGVEMQKL